MFVYNAYLCIYIVYMFALYVFHYIPHAHTFFLCGKI